MQCSEIRLSDTSRVLKRVESVTPCYLAPIRRSIQDRRSLVGRFRCCSRSSKVSSCDFSAVAVSNDAPLLWGGLLTIHASEGCAKGAWGVVTKGYGVTVESERKSKPVPIANLRPTESCLTERRYRLVSEAGDAAAQPATLARERIC